MERTGLLPAGVFLLVAWWLTPMTELAEFDPDEGVNLIKAMLHAQGYTLYEQVWSDQPPMMTLLLAQVYEWFGPTLVAARVVTLGFAALLVWAVYQTLRLRVAVMAATAGVVLMVLSRMYLRLSVSVMIGLPAVALAMLAIYLLLRSRTVQSRGAAVVLLVASGAVMALAMQTKLFVVMVVVPMVGVLVMPDAHGFNLWASWGQAIKARLWRAGVWLLAVVGVSAVSALLLGSTSGEQLVGTHVAAQGRTWGEHLHDVYRLAGMVARHAIYLPLAGAAVVWAWRRGVADVWLATGWFVLAGVVLSVHRPLWYHHVLLLTVPLAWLAGYGVQVWLDWQATATRRVAVAAVVAAGLALPLGTPIWRQLHEETFDYRFALHAEVVAELARTPWQGNPTRAWLLTDRPSYAYLSGRLVPPELAVQTSKRWAAGQITPEQVVAVLDRYQPRDVVLERYNNDHYGPAVYTYLQRHYTPHRITRHARSHFPPLRHHVRQGVARRSSVAEWQSHDQAVSAGVACPDR